MSILNENKRYNIKGKGPDSIIIYAAEAFALNKEAQGNNMLEQIKQDPTLHKALMKVILSHLHYSIKTNVHLRREMGLIKTRPDYSAHGKLTATLCFYLTSKKDDHITPFYKTFVNAPTKNFNNFAKIICCMGDIEKQNHEYEMLKRSKAHLSVR